MPLIDQVGRKQWHIRLIIAAMYLVLALLGVTMVFPFLITVSSSMTNAMDYYRFSPLPRSLYARDERFVKNLVPFFPETLSGSMDQAMHLFASMPAGWGTWKAAGEDAAGLQAFSSAYLAIPHNRAHWNAARLMAADYDAFVRSYPLEDSICTFRRQQVAPYLRAYYREQAAETGNGKGSLEERALVLMSEKWGIPYDSFYRVPASVAMQSPMLPAPTDGRAQDFFQVKAAYRDRWFLPSSIKAKWWRYLQSEDARGVLDLPGHGALTLQELNQACGTAYRRIKEIPFPVTQQHPAGLQQLWQGYTGAIVPACETRPFPMKVLWVGYLNSGPAREALGIDGGAARMTIEEYNAALGTQYASLREIPFPVATTAPPPLRKVWDDFVATQYPARMLEIRTDAAVDAAYRQFLQERFKGDLARCNAILNARYASWAAVHYPERLPADAAQSIIWQEYLPQIPLAKKVPHSAEEAYQRFLLQRYGSLQAINHRYGWQLSKIEQAQMPFDMAYLVSFVENERQWLWTSATQNFSFVLDYLLFRGQAVGNTVVLILLTLLAALTINPLAAYALSRFQIKQMPAIILFMLATMAFPAAVSMIPGYLLMRDLHLLNTYAALILPGIANGMSIFLLKGFFDSLPAELYEAAGLDGAKEWQVFWRITLPLSKPILAVIALNSFLAAYSSWEWALVVCQKQEMWTLSVWLYQFNTQWSTEPWTVMASFIIASIPVFLVFTFCQNIILRGIVLPQMK